MYVVFDAKNFASDDIMNLGSFYKRAEIEALLQINKPGNECLILDSERLEEMIDNEYHFPAFGQLHS